MLKRVFALIIKEFLILLRDHKVRAVLIAPPILQLFLFSFAATLEVSNVSLAIYNQDMGKHSHEIIQRLNGSSTFTQLYFVKSEAVFTRMLDEQKVIAAMHFPANFSRQIAAGQSAALQIILDGRKSNSAQIVHGYLNKLIMNYALEVTAKEGQTPLPLTIMERNWFNENLFYIWFTIPSLVVILATLITLMVTALSVAREKELGTFEQLLVSPLTPLEIILGKVIPAIVIGIGESLIIFCLSIFLFKVPFVGSFGLLLLTLFVFVLSVVGVGLFISSLAKTQQQAILGSFIFMVPAITLSGFAAPIENMPHWLQSATLANPLRHCMVAVRGLFLKNIAFLEVWANLWPLLIIGGLCLLLAKQFFYYSLE